MTDKIWMIRAGEGGYLAGDFAKGFVAIGWSDLGDRGLYVSTGGFTKEARYEAERSNFPLTLIEIDDLGSLVESHYESFDLDGRALVPLTRIYWPSQ